MLTVILFEKTPLINAFFSQTQIVKGETWAQYQCNCGQIGSLIGHLTAAFIISKVQLREAEKTANKKGPSE